MDAREDGCIYLENMDVKSSLFPMVTAKQTRKIPELFMIRQLNMTTLEQLDRGKRQVLQNVTDAKHFDITEKNRAEKAELDRRIKEEKRLYDEKK